jgi:hypothetical protein
MIISLVDLISPDCRYAARGGTKPMNQLVAFTDRAPALVVAAGERAQTRFWEFFVSNIRNPHTRRYGRSIAEFLAWCEQHGLTPECRA